MRDLLGVVQLIFTGDLDDFHVGDAEAFADDSPLVVIIFFEGALFAAVVADRGLERLHSHDGAVHLLLGQPAEHFGDLLVGDGGGLVEGFALDQFGQGGAGGDRGGAAEGFEFDVCDSSVFVQFEGQFEGVAAGGVADFADSVGVLDLPDVAGMQEMVHDLIGVIPHNNTLLSSIGRRGRRASPSSVFV